jgi:hypothetical protein
MARTLMQWTRPTVKIATTQAGLTAGLAVECQINSAMVTAVPATVTIPATGCAPATNAPGATGWQLDLAWLQDWAAGDDTESLSRFAFEHDTEAVWVQMIPNAADATNSPMTGQFFVVSGGYGGTFGDGSAAATTATWPALDKPTVGPAVVTVAADDEAVAADDEALAGV